MTGRDMAETLTHSERAEFDAQTNEEGLTWAAYMAMAPQERAVYGPWMNPRKQSKMPVDMRVAREDAVHAIMQMLNYPAKEPQPAEVTISMIENIVRVAKRFDPVPKQAEPAGPNPDYAPPSAKETMATKSGAMREKKDAIPYDLVPFIEITEAFARVAEFGAVKYEPWNWTKGLSRVQLLCSLLRHTFAYLRGRDKDAETGLSHADHILWNAAALVHNVHWGLEDGRRAEPPRDYNIAENNPVDKG